MLCSRVNVLGLFGRFTHSFPRSLHTQTSRLHTPKTSCPIDLSLYLVADRKSVTSDEEFFSKVSRAVKGGVSCVQLRDHGRPTDAILKTARQLKHILAAEGVPLIINTRIDIALAVSAEGIYFEQYHKSFLHSARFALTPQTSIGIPVHVPEEVLVAEHLAVNYLSVKIFPSKRTNPEDNQVWGLEGLEKLRSLTDHRIVAIGGITLENLAQVCQRLRLKEDGTGDGVAMVGDLWRTDDTSEIAAKVRSVMQTFSCHHKA